MWPFIFLALFILLIIQALFSYFQLKNIFDSTRKLKEKYKSCGYSITIGTSKTGFNLRGSTITILVLNEENIIMDYMEMSGCSVFKRFKRDVTSIGLTTEMAKNTLKSKNQQKAFKNALDVKKQREEQETSIALAK